MQLKKEGFPEEGELELCTVTKIFGHSVFVNIEDYQKQGMIHISEISPGRIRNLRDYVVEGKKIVCVVLRISKEKGHIDLSLRRVNDGQKRKKLERIKQEQKSEKIVEQIAKELHKEEKQFYDAVSEKIFKEYKDLISCFTDVVGGNADLKELGIEKEAAEKLTGMIKERMKPPKIIIGGKLSLQSFEGNGIEIIKETLKKIEDIGKQDLVVNYRGAGTYNISVTAKDYKKAEKTLKEITDTATKLMEKSKGLAEFQRVDNDK